MQYWNGKQIAGSLTQHNAGGQQRMPDKQHFQAVIGGEEMETAVRRLTPLECERLQGFPDDWTDIGEWVDSKGKTRQTTDSARYKALAENIGTVRTPGNSRIIVRWHRRFPLLLGEMQRQGNGNMGK